jgi:probable lipoprotein NlpC
MRESLKITKSVVINSILLTFLLTLIVSCKNSPKATSSTNDRPNNSQNSKVDKVIKTAKSYIGTKYKFGGSSRNGIDCSGLMCASFQSVNITLPRTSGDQSKVGNSVTLKDLEPGDLVFFTDRKGNNKITHVGLVTEVNGGKNVKFIHSSTKLGVVEDNLYAEYYISIFIKATRVF